jgi:hypothetical protein
MRRTVRSRKIGGYQMEKDERRAAGATYKAMDELAGGLEGVDDLFDREAWSDWQSCRKTAYVTG